MKPRRSTHRSPARFLGRVIEGATPAAFPGFVEPCCPTPRKVPPSGDAWLHEIKHDGYRAQVQFSDGVRIFTRRGHDWATRMPTIAAAVGALPVNNIILDGELVAVDGSFPVRGPRNFPLPAAAATARSPCRPGTSSTV